MSRDLESVARSSAEESLQDILSAVLDTLLPASSDGRMPAAGSLGLGPEICRELAKTPALWTMVREGLQQLDESCRNQYGVPFATASEEQRSTLLSAQPFAFPLFMQALVAYYRQPAVLRGLGLAPRPPHPEGYRLQDD